MITMDLHGTERSVFCTCLLWKNRILKRHLKKSWFFTKSIRAKIPIKRAKLPETGFWQLLTWYGKIFWGLVLEFLHLFRLRNPEFLGLFRWKSWPTVLPAMSFVSKAWSCETLSRGLGIVEKSAEMLVEADPDQEAMQAELERLIEPQPHLTNNHGTMIMSCYDNVGLLWLLYIILWCGYEYKKISDYSIFGFMLW